MSPRQSAAVYRRRRIVVFGGLIVVLIALIVLVWILIARSWASDAAPAPSPTVSSAAPSPSASTPPPDESAPEESAPPEAPVSPAPTETAAEGAACTAADVTVQAVTDADAYDPGTMPQLSISLTNKSGADCTLDVGTATQVFTVTSGSDVWWRSTDCQQNPSSMIVTLAAGSTVTSSVPVAWDRTRSSVEACAATDRQQAPGGGATYHLAVQIGGFESAETAAFILN
ncbi:hypothetical protein GCM10025768_23210 [Microbacterium pseudoresistens]|uniref:Cytoskeletal protein RodZ n=1 Tax=Microbacterium pseudoresistens TaxID=640634 RepID=A0A7Y9JM40_9MICO|nr:hypothetical protein [Microbacterium pseudoresistens]NYD53616.1 cytoskeletal protein RodZ [Microbacterium pseudoresistens]